MENIHQDVINQDLLNRIEQLEKKVADGYKLFNDNFYLSEKDGKVVVVSKNSPSPEQLGRQQIESMKAQKAQERAIRETDKKSTMKSEEEIRDRFNYLNNKLSTIDKENTYENHLELLHLAWVLGEEN